jgi:hypothetical protein
MVRLVRRVDFCILGSAADFYVLIFSQEVIMVHFGAVKKFLEEQRFVKVTDFAAGKKRSKRTKKKKKKRK